MFFPSQDENPVFWENLLLWEISDLSNNVHGRQNIESYHLLCTNNEKDTTQWWVNALMHPCWNLEGNS